MGIKAEYFKNILMKIEILRSSLIPKTEAKIVMAIIILPIAFKKTHINFKNTEFN